MSAPDPAAPLDLQAVRLAAVTASAITEHRHVTREDWPVLDEALSGLFVLLGEVERLSQEVTTREMAARHALEAATKAQAELEEAEDERAEAYLVEAQCWDLLRETRRYVDGSVSDPTDHERRYLASLIEHQLTAEPPAVARALWERLRTAETVAEVALPVPDLLGEGNFSAEAIDRTKAHLLAALAAWKAARAGEGR
jgi:hypothetical protein